VLLERLYSTDHFLDSKTICQTLHVLCEGFKLSEATEGSVLLECLYLRDACVAVIEDAVQGKGSSWKKFCEEVMTDNIDVIAVFVHTLGSYIHECKSIKQLTKCFDLLESLPNCNEEMSSLILHVDCE
jgi:hypothetical protein